MLIYISGYIYCAEHSGQMSYAYSNFREQIDMRKKYIDFINSKIANNKYLADKFNNSIYYSSLGIQPPQEPPTSSEQLLQDFSKQRELSFKNLKEITDEQNAVAILSRLTTLDNIVEFNTYFGMFKEAIKGQVNITPIIFETLWRQFREKLRDEGKLINRLPEERELGILPDIYAIEDWELPPDYKKNVEEVKDEFFDEKEEELKTADGKLKFIYNYIDKIVPEVVANSIITYIINQTDNKEATEIILEDVENELKPYYRQVLLDYGVNKKQANITANKGIIATFDLLNRTAVLKEAEEATKEEKRAKKRGKREQQRREKREIKEAEQKTREVFMRDIIGPLQRRGKAKSMKTELQTKVEERKINELIKLIKQNVSDAGDQKEMINDMKEAIEAKGVDFAYDFYTQTLANYRPPKTKMMEELKQKRRVIQPVDIEGKQFYEEFKRRTVPLIQELKTLKPVKRKPLNIVMSKQQQRVKREAEGEIKKPDEDIIRELGGEPSLRDLTYSELTGLTPEQKGLFRFQQSQRGQNSDSYKILMAYSKNAGPGKIFKEEYQGQPVDSLYIRLNNEDEKLAFLSELINTNYKAKSSITKYSEFIDENERVLRPIINSIGRRMPKNPYQNPTKSKRKVRRLSQ